MKIKKEQVSFKVQLKFWEKKVQKRNLTCRREIRKNSMTKWLFMLTRFRHVGRRRLVSWKGGMSQNSGKRPSQPRSHVIQKPQPSGKKEKKDAVRMARRPSQGRQYLEPFFYRPTKAHQNAK